MSASGGTVVLRDKEHLVVIRPYQRELVTHILHYLDEIRPADEILELKDMQKVSPDSKELSLGKLSLENLSRNLLVVSDARSSVSFSFCIPTRDSPIAKQIASIMAQEYVSILLRCYC